MHDYINLRLDVSPCSQDITDLLAAFLADVGFESFEPDENGLNAYIKNSDFNRDAVNDVISSFPIDTNITLSHDLVQGKNWNSEWEKNYFKPIVIDDKCSVHASFHKDYTTSEFNIVIDPKMAFGTGHHSTTAGMIRLILEEDLKGKKVADVGTGSGILAMLCKMKNADEVSGIEIDEFAAENARENCFMNNLDVKIITGDASALSQIEKVNVLLANINRNIIINDLENYINSLTDDGILLLSGFYKEDIPLIGDETEKFGYSVTKIKEDKNWVAIKLEKTNK